MESLQKISLQHFNISFCKFTRFYLSWRRPALGWVGRVEAPPLGLLELSHLPARQLQPFSQPLSLQLPGAPETENRMSEHTAVYLPGSVALRLSPVPSVSVLQLVSQPD